MIDKNKYVDYEDDRGIMSPEVENMTDEELREEFKRITGHYPEKEKNK